MHIADWKWALILAAFYAAKYWWAWVIPLAAFIAWRWRKRAAAKVPAGYVNPYGETNVPPAALSVPAAWATDPPDAKDRTQQAQQPAAAVPEGYVPVSALIDAREEVESWAAYAAPYFQDKHDLAGTLAKMDAQIAQAQQPAAAVPEGYALVPVQSLRWWRELAEINPQDLVPRIDAMLAAAAQGEP